MLVCGLLLAGALLLGPGGRERVQAQSDERCFEQTEHCISGRILEFWTRNGGLNAFGLPISPLREQEIDGQLRQVQWFERNRLELHPEQPRPYDVQVGRIGVEALEQRGVNWFALPRADGPRDNCLYFEETQQNVCDELMTAWLVEGIDLNEDGISGNSFEESLALFGAPISGEMLEVLGDGQEYTVQYFERARFERHPQNEPPFNVLLGLLGREVLFGGGIRVEDGVALVRVGVQGEEWLFDQEQLGPLVPGQQVRLTFDNSSTVFEHNWVLLNTVNEEVARQVVEASIAAGPENAYLPADRSAILATTSLLAPEQAEEISFTLPDTPGAFRYVCTVPGHYAAGMEGVLTVGE
jgi:uncharacterized cupredoxin-like copper-binding protein